MVIVEEDCDLVLILVMVSGQLMTMTMIWDNDGVILPMQWSDVSDM